MAELSWDNAIKKVLKENGGEMHYTEIAQEIIEKGYRKEVGATPARTVAARLSQLLRNKQSNIYRSNRGNYYYKGKSQVSPDSDERSGIIGAFGMYWKRDKVNWKNKRLLGMELSGSEVIDFSEQKGVYILYNDQKVVYVGRSRDSIISRLYDHTRDKLSSRWNSFSWFGIYKVGDDGNLIKNVGRAEEHDLINLMEAILIEVMEPPLNRRRGDDIEDVEYIQAIDTEYEREQLDILRRLQRNF